MSLYVFYTCKDDCGCYCILKTYLLKNLFKKKYFRHFETKHWGVKHFHNTLMN